MKETKYELWKYENMKASLADNYGFVNDQHSEKKDTLIFLFFL